MKVRVYTIMLNIHADSVVNVVVSTPTDPSDIICSCMNIMLITIAIF